MLTQQDLDLFKLCDIPKEAAQLWLKTLANGSKVKPGFWIWTKQQADIGGDIVKLCIYCSGTDRYHLIQDPTEEN